MRQEARAAFTPEDWEREVICLTNQERLARGLYPLRHNPVLTEAARAHNGDMIANGFFNHRGSDESTSGERGCRLGYRPYWSQFSADNVPAVLRLRN